MHGQKSYNKKNHLTLFNELGYQYIQRQGISRYLPHTVERVRSATEPVLQFEMDSDATITASENRGPDRLGKEEGFVIGKFA